MTDGYTRLGVSSSPFMADPGSGVRADLWLDRPIAPPDDDEIVELIGPPGAGKTSLLLHWQRSVGGPYVRVEPGRARWKPPPLAPVVYWDDADRIPRLILRQAITVLGDSGGRAAHWHPPLLAPGVAPPPTPAPHGGPRPDQGDRHPAVGGQTHRRGGHRTHTRPGGVRRPGRPAGGSV